jgi:hypothetical protein
VSARQRVARALLISSSELCTHRGASSDARLDAVARCPVCHSNELEIAPYEKWPPPAGVALAPPYENALGTPSYEGLPELWLRVRQRRQSRDRVANILRGVPSRVARGRITPDSWSSTTRAVISADPRRLRYVWEGAYPFTEVDPCGAPQKTAMDATACRPRPAAAHTRPATAKGTPSTTRPSA